MPKTKTSSAAKKKFKVTGTGKLLRRQGMTSHNFEKKSPKRKRRLAGDEGLSPTDERSVRKLLRLR